MALVVKNQPANAEGIREEASIPGVGKISLEKEIQPTPLFLPGKFHGHRSVAAYSPWRCKELDTTEQLNFNFSNLGPLYNK